MLTSEIPGTLLDLGCQFQWSLGVWYNTLYSAEDHDINATVAKMTDQKYHLQTIRKVWSFLKQNFEGVQQWQLKDPIKMVSPGFYL